jgi:hypothetical protein
MNQILKPARPEDMRFGGDPVREREIDPRALQTGIVEYDDGNPATVVSDAPTPITRQAITEQDATESSRTPLGRIRRTMAVDYDDGNPATIATDIG